MSSTPSSPQDAARLSHRNLCEFAFVFFILLATFPTATAAPWGGKKTTKNPKSNIVDEVLPGDLDDDEGRNSNASIAPNLLDKVIPGDSDDDEGASALRTAVRIEGLEGLTEEEVLGRLGGRLDFVTSRPPSRSRADDADFLVRRFLEKEGYKDVDISWKISEDRRAIILRVRSGARITIGEVQVTGVPEEDINDITAYYTGKSLFGGQTSVPYIEDNLPQATENAVTYLKAQGYWDATGELTRNTIDEQSREANLTFSAEPGTLYKINSIRIEGSIPPELPKIADSLQSYLERTATASRLREIREGSAAKMRNEGYQFAEAFADVTHRNGRTDIVVTLEPGARYRLRQALLTGAPGIDISRVRRYFNSFSGKPYDENGITEFRNILLATGAFDSVDRDREVFKEEQAIDVTLHLDEGKPKGISYYGGAGSFEGFIVGASYYDRNFLSKLYNLNVAAEFSGIGFLGEVSITDPFLFGYNLRSTPRAFILRNSFDEYSILESGVGWTVSRDFDSRQTLEFNAEISFATTSGEELPTSALGATDYLVARAGAAYLFDARNSTVSPSKGFFGRLDAEVGYVVANTPNTFFELGGQFSYHLPLNEKSRLVFNIETGLLVPSNDEELPVDLRFFIGGDDSVRSFPNRELGPQVDNTSRGGLAFWNANIEYVRKLVGPVDGVAFFDAGSLSEDASDWPSSEAKLAAGLGIRLDLPIGPVRLEYGRSLNPSGNDPSGAFHFSIGASF